MKITDVQAYYPRYGYRLPEWRPELWQIVVRVDTDVGVTGWGWGGGGRASLPIVTGHFRELLIGRSVDSTPDIAALWEPLTGIGWSLYRLLEHLAQRQDLRLRLYPPTTVWSSDLDPPVVPLPEGPAIETVTRRVPADFILPAGWIIRLLRLLEPLLIAADGNAVLFAPNYFLPRRYRLSRGTRVTTVHDLGVRRVPWTLQRETLDELTAKLERQIARSERLITVSRAVRDELAEYGYADPVKVHAIHHGPGQLADVEPGPLPPGFPERFGLHVGTLEPRKNITVLLEAWELVRRRRSSSADATAGRPKRFVPPSSAPKAKAGFSIPAISTMLSSPRSIAGRRSSSSPPCTRVSVCRRSRPCGATRLWSAAICRYCTRPPAKQPCSLPRTDPSSSPKPSSR